MLEFAPKNTEIIANWDTAIMYCQFLDIDGKNDWRLPTFDELYSLDGNIDDLELHGLWLWTGTETNLTHAWVLGFDIFQPPMRQVCEKQYICSIRLVRDI
jgi:hypothetical protein